MNIEQMTISQILERVRELEGETKRLRIRLDRSESELAQWKDSAAKHAKESSEHYVRADKVERELAELKGTFAKWKTKDGVYAAPYSTVFTENGIPLTLSAVHANQYFSTREAAEAANHGKAVEG